MNLSLVPSLDSQIPTEPVSPGKVSPDSALARAKGELVSNLEDKLEELRKESERIHNMMEQVMYRVNTRGFNANLDGFTVEGWKRLVTEVRVLQDALALIESHE